MDGESWFIFGLVTAISLEMWVEKIERLLATVTELLGKIRLPLESEATSKRQYSVSIIQEILT